MHRKVLLSLAFVFILGTGTVCAAQKEMKEEELQAEHGQDLASAPFVIRYKFLQANTKEWEDAGYDERKEFLTAWYDEQAVAKKQAEDEAKLETQLLKEEMFEAKTLQREKKEKERLVLQKERDEQRQKAEEERAFRQEVKDRERALKKLREAQHKCRADGVCF